MSSALKYFQMTGAVAVIALSSTPAAMAQDAGTASPSAPPASWAGLYGDVSLGGRFFSANQRFDTGTSPATLTRRAAWAVSASGTTAASVRW